MNHPFQQLDTQTCLPLASLNNCVAPLLGWALVAALAGCSGGGSDGGSPPPATLGGTVAVGLPLVSTNIKVVCKEGGQVTKTTDANGAWSLVITNQVFPCAVQATGGTIGAGAGAATNTTAYHSVALAAGTVNVTPLTDLMMANVVGATTNPTAWFTGLAAGTPNATAPLTNVSKTAIDGALNQLKAVLPTLAALTATQPVNPLTTAFTPVTGNAYDDMLTALGTAMKSANLTHAEVLTASLQSTPIFGLGGTVAAAGKALAGYSISLRCTGGSTLSTTTGTDGAWLVKLTDQVFPCAVQAAPAGTGVSYHAIALGAGTVNVTPLTDLVVANLAGSADPSGWFASLATATTSLAAITPTQVDAAIGKLRGSLAKPSALASVNPMTTVFSANTSDPVGNYLTSLQLTLNITGLSHTSLLATAATQAFAAPVGKYGTDFATTISAVTAQASKPASPVTLSGTVAVGAPLVGATVAVKCASGSPVSATTSSTGAWFAVLGANSFPCALQATGGTIGSTSNTTPYHAVATTAGTVNVTPLTDLVVASLAGNADPKTWYTSFTNSAGDIGAAVTKVAAALPAIAAPTTTLINPLTTPFAAVAGDPVDAQLVALQKALAIPVTQVRYDVLLANMAVNQKPDARFLTALVDPTCAAPKAAASTAATAGSLVLNASRTTGVAPLAVNFETYNLVTNTTSIGTAAEFKKFHEVKYTWDFGDPACGATWAYGTKANVAKKNAAYGPLAAHVFETPGTYTVTLTGFDGTNTSSKTTTITVTDPNAVFASNTLCVSNTSFPVAGLDGCPTGASVKQITNSWKTLGTASSTYKRILLKRNEEWLVDATLGISSVNASLIGAYGVGGNPRVIMMSNLPAINVSSAADFRILDLEITSDKNPQPYEGGVTGYDSKNTLLLRLNIHHVQSGMQSLLCDGLFIVDTIFDEMFTTPAGVTWHGGPTAYLDTTDHLAILGSSLTNSHSSHVIRVQGSANSVVSHSTFAAGVGFSYHVFTLRGKANDTSAGRLIWNNLWTENIVISDNVVDGSLGSIYTLHHGPQNSLTAERLRNIITERNIVLGKDLQAGAFAVAENLTVRNNIFMSPHNYTIVLEANISSYTPSTSNTFIYNNTFYKPSSSSNTNYSSVQVSGGGVANGIYLKNNLAYGPGNLRNGSQSTAGGATFLLVDSGTEGVNFYTNNLGNSTDQQVNSTKPWLLDQPLIANDYKPTSNSYAANGGVTVPVFTDYNDDIINFSSPPIGALLP